MSFNIGEMVGPYRIAEQMGQGGMATVYKAYHAALDRYVAIKVLHPAFLEDRSFLARFQREARLVAKLDHPNIVPIFDYAEHEGRPYLVMKFIEGETLKARLVRGPVPPAETIRIVEAVGAALSYAHQRGILHRDIKPSNVLLEKDGGIFLADFGLARIAQSGESTLTSDMILGTPQYISPEQALGKKDLDQGTDIYSFGVMLYELTVGKVPFSADTPFSIIHDHIYSPLPMPRQVNPGVAPEVERVLLKALAKERHDRYKDVQAMVEAFQQAWQVSTIKLPDEEPTLVTGIPSPLQPATIPAGQPPPAVVAAPRGAEPAPMPVAAVSRSGEKMKKKINWMWLAAGVILILGCLVTLPALLSLRRPRMLILTPQPTPVQVVQAVVTPAKASGIDGARQLVTQNPNDPWAHLQLAMEYYAAGMQDLAQTSLANAEEKAGENESFFWEAGGRLADQGAWVLAARMYVAASEIHMKTNKSLAADQADRLHEAIYKAFITPDATVFIPFDRLAKIDESLALVAKARYAFYNTDQKQGLGTLEQLNKLKPGIPEGLLLQAEFSVKTGKPDAARAALRQLNNNPGTTAWMRAEADLIKKSLP